jgi:ABC-type glycerol-3-phosphate transport system substrate-binding protein
MPVQKEIFKKGSTPVRKSAYEDPEVKEWIRTEKYPGAAISQTMLEAWKEENLEFVEGKFPQLVETAIIQYTELAYMLQGMKTPEQAMKDAVKQTNDVTGYTKLKEAAGK